MISFVALALLAQPTSSFPSVHIAGDAFVARVDVVAGADGVVNATLLEPAGFTVGGMPLAPALNTQGLRVAPGTKLSVTVDLGPALTARGVSGDFQLDWLGDEAPAQSVRGVVPFVTEDSFLDETKFPVAALADVHVVLVTNQGTMELEFWPDVAPNHVRNYLELCRTGFYNQTLFHRVGPGFMIQGGDPKTKELKLRNEWGTGSGPRKLVEELSSVKKHERGVLSMASGGPKTNTASSQFFVMHGPNPGLDGKYTCFGRLVSGFDALDKIATANGTPLPDRATFRPTEPQRIEKAILTMVKKG